MGESTTKSETVNRNSNPYYISINYNQILVVKENCRKHFFLQFVCMFICLLVCLYGGWCVPLLFLFCQCDTNSGHPG